MCYPPCSMPVPLRFPCGPEQRSLPCQKCSQWGLVEWMLSNQGPPYPIASTGKVMSKEWFIHYWDVSEWVPLWKGGRLWLHKMFTELTNSVKRRVFPKLCRSGFSLEYTPVILSSGLLALLLRYHACGSQCPTFSSSTWAWDSSYRMWVPW